LDLTVCTATDPILARAEPPDAHAPSTSGPSGAAASPASLAATRASCWLRTAASRRPADPRRVTADLARGSPCPSRSRARSRPPRARLSRRDFDAVDTPTSKCDAGWAPVSERERERLRAASRPAGAEATPRYGKEPIRTSRSRRRSSSVTFPRRPCRPGPRRQLSSRIHRTRSTSHRTTLPSADRCRMPERGRDVSTPASISLVITREKRWPPPSPPRRWTPSSRCS
jgi:hypothetical protein